MSQFSVTILGINSSLPAFGRSLSSQIINIGNELYMVDCGEGTQVQLSRYRIKRNKIKAIFISHFHGDHLYGLPGLLSSYTHFERKESLKIFGPVGLKKYLETIFEISQVHLGFPLEIVENEIPDNALQLYEDDTCQVFGFPLQHRMPTQGYVFIEKTDHFKIDIEKIKHYKLSNTQIQCIKKGNPIEIEGQEIDAFFFCLPRQNSRKYVYASDTSPLEEYPAIIENADLLYHEATYLHDLAKVAYERGHSTSIQAANFAKKIEAKQLIIGHFSSRYKDVSMLELEAKIVFDKVVAGVEGKTYMIE
jgi:ribonuclease Z